VIDWLGSGLSNIHRCPKCACTFEKISGCAQMDCSICHHRWCWACGQNLDSVFHEKLEPICQMFNVFALHEKIPSILKPVMALLTLILLPIVFSFIAPLAIAFEVIEEKFAYRPSHRYSRRREKEPTFL